MHAIINYILGQLDKVTAWIGFIGLLLIFLDFHGVLTLLFLLLIVLPEAQFSDVFKKWTQEIRDLNKSRRP